MKEAILFGTLKYIDATNNCKYFIIIKYFSINQV